MEGEGKTGYMYKEAVAEKPATIIYEVQCSAGSRTYNAEVLWELFVDTLRLGKCI